MADNPGDGEVSAFSSITVRDAAYARIRERIISSEAVTRFWRRKHNELSITSRLPPEILSAIFKCTAEPETSDSEYETLEGLSWIHVSHVCSHWRQVALDSPSLWSDIPFNLPSLAKEMLVRSKQAPLTVKVEFGEYHRNVAYHNAQAATAALKQLSRVKHLSLSHFGRDNYQNFMEYIKFLNSPAPLLETLNITFNVPTKEIKLPENIFSGESPPLTHLTLTQCVLNWRAPIFANLRSLIFINTNVGAISGPPADQFISALSTMPRLEKLEFDASFDPAGGALDKGLAADFPRLTELGVTSPLLDCILLLDHINYPDTSRSHIVCNIEPLIDDPTTTLALVQKLAEKLVNRVQGTIHSLALYRQEIKVWTLPEIFPSHMLVQPQNDMVPEPQLDFRLYSLVQSSSAVATKLTTKMLQPLPLRHLESLLVYRFDLQQTEWLRHFGALCGLKDLCVELDHSGFLDAFCSGTSAALDPSERVDGPNFKALRSLEIRGWIFDEYHRHDWPGRCADILKQCLKAREKEGVALYELLVNDCIHVAWDDVVELQAIVEKAIWDGLSHSGLTDYEMEEEESNSEPSGYSSDGLPIFNGLFTFYP